MGDAAFLLVFNFAIGLSFAAAFLALTWRSKVALGRWCAAGFVAAATTVAVEGFASAIPSARLVSVLSFSSLLLGMTLIVAGLLRHYRPGASIAWLIILFLAGSLLNGFYLFEVPRGTTLNAFGYQGPFALLTLLGAMIVLVWSPRRPADLALAAVLGLSGLQFLAKAVLAAAAGSGPGVRDYLASTYAQYSQTAGGILSLLLGLALVGVVAVEVMAEAARRLERDSLSGALNRGAFLQQADQVLRRTPQGICSSLIMVDLDHFKSINDRFGHAAGDDVIRACGTSLVQLAGTDGLCGRVGGEEFCILLTDCNIAAARIYVDAIRSLIGMTRFPMLPEGYRVTASFGIAVTDRLEPLADAMHRADLALYEAKAAGRDGYRFAPLSPAGTADFERPAAAFGDG
ncbi:diguanylate cyclase (GGDEF) domain-containing protein [Kaistia soli DSM 19436]|uniref:diguanylate cyclase n=1 Tax=Kaistia soli DSM 19436 TaxID=1122133 RepID=A0A1M5DFT3_9HYPH|nr:GGDEF domain-containing protein [Kaistia soli]SHF65532.1 diguanylate cyclase (GGDEF) domain-containing protein [Kaistia soli DSM 19436]